VTEWEFARSLEIDFLDMPRNIYPHNPLFSKTTKYLCASFVPIEQQINNEENTPAFVALNEEQNNALY